MNLGIFLHRGGSLSNWKKFGQDKRVIKYYLEKYSKEFDNVYLFSYDNEKRDDLPKNVFIIPNNYKIPFSIYGVLIPIIHNKIIKKCNVFRIFHISGTPTGIITTIFYKKPYITTYGYLWLNDILFHKKRFEYIIARPIEKIGLKMASKVIVTTSKIENYVKYIIDKKKVVIIPNGVDVSLFKKKLVRKKQKRRIISIGRLVKIKNYDSLIRAVSMIKNSELVIIGDGPEKKNLQSLAKKLGCKLSITGMIPNEMIPNEINKSNIFVLPSYSEGMPKALIEAMSCQIPCIVSDIPTLKEIINDGVNGIICTTKVDDIKAKIEFVLDNLSIANKISKNARKDITNKFSIDKLVDKEINILKMQSKF